MLFDELRNGFYAEAIKNAVSEQSIVLDLGAGLGLHGFIAAIAGARKTYLVDPSPILQITESVVAANGLKDRVCCIQKTIEETTLPESVDVIVSVFTGNFLLTEDLLPSLFYARDKFLRPGGTLIPDRAEMEIALVSAPEFYKKVIEGWTEGLFGVDYSAVRQFAANSIYYDTPEAMVPILLSDPGLLQEMNLVTATEAACRNRIEVTVKKSGTCHGCVGWFNIHVGNNWLSTSPLKKQTHWRQVFLPLAEPLDLTTGETVGIELHRPEFGEWTWTIETAKARQRQSTFFSEPHNLQLLQKRKDDYRPGMGAKGRVLQEIIQRIGRGESNAVIAKGILQAFPELFPSQNHAQSFLLKLIEKYF